MLFISVINEFSHMHQKLDSYRQKASEVTFIFEI